MKLLAKISTLVCLYGLLAGSSAQAKLNVVATLPDFGSIAEQIGGDKVKVTSLARGTEDPHFVDARPSHITTLNKADVLLEGGLELEIGWLPPLVNSARNGKILTGAKGRVVMADDIHIMEVPLTPVDRSMGDVHPLGNPHFWTDPENGKVMAAHLVTVFSELDGKNAAFYQANLKAFDAK